MKQLEVVAAVIIQDGRLFCAQRADRGETARKWEFPGGKIEVGESHHQALEREIFEELGLSIAIGPRLISTEHRYAAFQLCLHAYLATIISGRLVLTEHLDSRWLLPSELDGLDWAPADLPIVDAVRKLLANQ